MIDSAGVDSSGKGGGGYQSYLEEEEMVYPPMPAFPPSISLLAPTGFSSALVFEQSVIFHLCG